MCPKRDGPVASHNHRSHAREEKSCHDLNLGLLHTNHTK